MLDFLDSAHAEIVNCFASITTDEYLREVETATMNGIQWAPSTNTYKRTGLRERDSAVMAQSSTLHHTAVSMLRGWQTPEQWVRVRQRLGQFASLSRGMEWSRMLKHATTHRTVAFDRACRNFSALQTLRVPGSCCERPTADELAIFD